MIKHGLLVCSFNLKHKYTRGEEKDLISLNDSYEFDGNKYKDFFELFKGFVDNYSEFHNDDKLMKMFAIKRDSIKEKHTDEYGILSGIIESGSYGIESKITDVETKEVMYNRKKTDADNKDFQFLIYIPKGKTSDAVIKGILMFEMIGSYGVKTITVENMRTFFGEKYGLTLETRSISVRIFIEKLLREQKLNRITMIRNAVSRDPADNMFVSVGREEKSYIKPKLTDSWVAKLLRFIDGSDVNEVFETPDGVMEDICMSFSHMGRNKTVRLSNIDKFSMIEDIPQSVYSGNEVEREKLKQYMEETAEKYAEKMVFVFE